MDASVYMRSEAADEQTYLSERTRMTEDVHEYCTAHGIRIVSQHITIGRNWENGAFEDALTNEKAEALILWDAAVLARDAHGRMMVTERLKTAGKKLVLVTENRILEPIDPSFARRLHRAIESANFALVDG